MRSSATPRPRQSARIRATHDATRICALPWSTKPTRCVIQITPAPPCPRTRPQHPLYGIFPSVPPPTRPDYITRIHSLLETRTRLARRRGRLAHCYHILRRSSRLHYRVGCQTACLRCIISAVKAPQNKRLSSSFDDLPSLASFSGGE